MKNGSGIYMNRLPIRCKLINTKRYSVLRGRKIFWSFWKLITINSILKDTVDLFFIRASHLQRWEMSKIDWILLRVTSKLKSPKMNTMRLRLLNLERVLILLGRIHSLIPNKDNAMLQKVWLMYKMLTQVWCKTALSKCIRILDYYRGKIPLMRVSTMRAMLVQSNLMLK